MWHFELPAPARSSMRVQTFIVSCTLIPERREGERDREREREREREKEREREV